MAYQLLIAGIKRGTLPPLLDVDDTHETIEEMGRKICDCAGAEWCIDVTGLSSPLGLSEPFCLTSNDAGDREPRTEQLPLALFAVSHDFYAYRGHLDRVSQQVLRWLKNDRTNNSIWLYERRNNEAGWRRSWLQRLWYDDGCILSTDPSSEAVALPTRATRTWWYEDVDFTFIQPPLITRNPDIMNFALPAIGGTEYGRIAALELVKDQVWLREEDFIFNTQTITITSRYRPAQVWAGIKESDCGVNEWQSDWTLENAESIEYEPPFGAAPVDLAQPIVDPTSGETCWEGDFQDLEDLTARVEITLEDAVASMPGAFTDDVWSQWAGRYLLLAEVQVDVAPTLDSHIVSFSAEYGWECSPPYRQTNRISTIDHDENTVVNGQSNRGSQWVEVGEVQFPVDSNRAIDPRYCDELRQSVIRLKVGLERGPDTTTWRVCRFRFVPIEHIIRVDVNDDCLLENGDFADPSVIRITRAEDDHMNARLYRLKTQDAGYGPYKIGGNISVSEHDWYLPYAKPTVLVTAVNAALSRYDLPVPIQQAVPTLYAEHNWPITPDMWVYRRWLSVRTD